MFSCNWFLGLWYGIFWFNSGKITPKDSQTLMKYAIFPHPECISNNSQLFYKRRNYFRDWDLPAACLILTFHWAAFHPITLTINACPIGSFLLQHLGKAICCIKVNSSLYVFAIYCYDSFFLLSGGSVAVHYFQGSSNLTVPTSTYWVSVECRLR